MSVALENARLFDETQRLFKESEQRAAELAIINSVQQALAAELTCREFTMRWATRFARSSTWLTSASVSMRRKPNCCTFPTRMSGAKNQYCVEPLGDKGIAATS